MSDTPWNDPPPRSPLVIPFDLPAYWTPEQALAVVELLDDLRERIADHYVFELNEALRQLQCTGVPVDLEDDLDDGEPF